MGTDQPLSSHPSKKHCVRSGHWSHRVTVKKKNEQMHERVKELEAWLDARDPNLIGLDGTCLKTL